jgi:hypothetical protein
MTKSQEVRVTNQSRYHQEFPEGMWMFCAAWTSHHVRFALSGVRNGAISSLEARAVAPCLSAG